MPEDWDDNIHQIIRLKEFYISTIEDVIKFLQGGNPTLARSICSRRFLPEAGRFRAQDDLVWAFGAMGMVDKAKYLATMYLEDLADLITTCVDPYFGFSRYAERISRSASSFDHLYEAVCGPQTFVDRYTIQLVDQYLAKHTPELVAFTVPFPGNLYAALRCASHIKQNYPAVQVAIGGGYPNTELRSLTDARVFEFIDFITLDDGEVPLRQLVDYIGGKVPKENLKRTFLKESGRVAYYNDNNIHDLPQEFLGTPDYSDLPLHRYISAIEVANPMHSLWSDGRWNKLTMAHGCYWGKCTFCDISLNYIQHYEPLTAVMLCDRMEEIIRQTGDTGFHFVDEAAPP